MMKVTYTVRNNDRNGYMEDGVKHFNSMPEVFAFLQRINLNRRVEGKVLVGVPVLEDVQG